MEILKLSSQKITLGCLFLLFLGGCSLFNPYIDRRRNPGAADLSHLYSGPSTPDKPVICYNGWFTNDATLQQMADAECIKHGTGTKAEFIKKTSFDGKLLLPSHAHYQCVNPDLIKE
jgi:hypothetical protein